MDDATCVEYMCVDTEDNPPGRLSYGDKVVISIAGAFIALWLAMLVIQLFVDDCLPQLRALARARAQARAQDEPPRGRTQVRASEAGTELSNLGGGSGGHPQ
ncbi:hypothetical protein CIB48_g4117 [Xylaria polymorpha]|nr:hypothetical protein CIB48_g4117 [Xylaria polymorpha]